MERSQSSWCVGEVVRREVGASVGPSVGVVLGGSVGGPVGGSVGGSVGGLVGGSVGVPVVGVKVGEGVGSGVVISTTDGSVRSFVVGSAVVGSCVVSFASLVMPSPMPAKLPKSISLSSLSSFSSPALSGTMGPTWPVLATSSSLLADTTTPTTVANRTSRAKTTSQNRLRLFSGKNSSSSSSKTPPTLPDALLLALPTLSSATRPRPAPTGARFLPARSSLPPPPRLPLSPHVEK
mmetsp:Transcript_39960/g.81611  ORF Transcript_39960/g.81611 Transcript_39960/m.81611 type:complete len:236 (+) Transcript_39960:74-781(+)